MRYNLTCLLAILVLTLPLPAAQVDEASTLLLGKYEGYFQWDGMEERSPIRFTFQEQEPATGGAFEATGVGEYLDANPPIRIKLRAHYQPSSGVIEIWESDPDSKATIFETNGSHVGTFTKGTIRARWSTRGSGEQGQLYLKRVGPGL